METNWETFLARFDPIIKKGLKEKLTKDEITSTLAKLLFEANEVFHTRLIEVRDYGTIKKKGTFRYAGKADSLFKEGLIPKDVYDELKTIMKEDTRHIGPSYLKVKGLLTFQRIRTFFGRQMAFTIRDYLKSTPPSNPDGFLVCIPNMTGGVWIGDETRRQLEDILTEYKVWPSTPYARQMRKRIDVISPDQKFTDYIEGPVPPPKDTSIIFCFEELRTTAETTQSATRVYKGFGYTEENNVKIVESCVFDYGHPAGVERIKRLGADRLYLVDGKEFFETSKKLGYISESQYETVIDWLTTPWEFTRKVLPDVKNLMGIS